MIKKAPGAVAKLWHNGFFRADKSFDEVTAELKKEGVNHPDANLKMALRRSKFIKVSKTKPALYAQKYPPVVLPGGDDVLPADLVAALGKPFETEIRDLRLNYGQSGTCTAFLLRKILEKLLFLAFMRNGLGEKIKDAEGNFIGLKAMLKLAQGTTIKGGPLLLPQTAAAVDGVKFLGDIAAHDPFTNVDMKTIAPAMPFVITAYQQLARVL